MQVLLDTEHQEELWSEGELVGGRVEYRDPDRKAFARKELSFERDSPARQQRSGSGMLRHSREAARQGF